jgi:hypothetical protein
LCLENNASTGSANRKNQSLFFFLALCELLLNPLFLQQSSKKYLSLHPVIRRLLAGAMLIVFAFGVTPKKILHDLVANHKDNRVVASASAIIKISADGFTCKCDNLVAESPFTDAVDQHVLPAATSFAVQESAMLACIYVSTHFFFSLRGPPTAGV